MHKPHGNTRLIKTPWVPPPARTTKKRGNASILGSEVAANYEVRDPSTQDHQTVHPLPSEILHETFIIDVGVNLPTSSSAVPNLSLPNNTKTVWNLNPLSLAMDKTAAQDKKIEDLYMHLQNLKDDLSRFRPVCISLMELLQLLHKPFSVSTKEELTMNQMIIQADQHFREFLGIFDTFENHISSSERFLKDDLVELTNHLQESSNCKEKVFIKCLEVYDSVTSSLKFLVEAIQQENISSLFTTHDELTCKVETLQEEFLSREGEIQRLVKSLSLSQKKVNSLQSKKHSLEEKVSLLNTELRQKDSLLEQLKLQSYTSNYEIRSIAENENLIKIMEGLKLETESEKNALKKALKLQKLRAEQCDITVKQLQNKLAEKERDMLDLAADRDQWKKNITNINYKFTESGNEIELLKLRNSSLKKQLENLEEAQIKSVSEINTMMEEKSKLLAVMSKEKEKLNVTQKSVEQMFLSSENEKELLRQKCENLEAKLNAQEKNTRDSKNDSEKDLQVLKVLEELKEALSIIKKCNLQASNKENSTETKSNLKASNSSSENDLFELVKEIKDLIQTKEIHHYSLEDNIKNVQIASAGSRRQELEHYDQEIAQKQKLLERIEEKLYSTSVKSPVTEHYPMDTSRNLQAMESTSQMKITSLEEELRNKNLELVSIQQHKSDVEHKNEAQICELTSNLDRVTSNYDSLHKYVTMLKSSYTNVFGPS